MVIDISAVLAWLKNEPERERIAAALEAHPLCSISAVSLLEAYVVSCVAENIRRWWENYSVSWGICRCRHAIR
jgi:uncharacterized protein with PIN domain